MTVNIFTITLSVLNGNQITTGCIADSLHQTQLKAIITPTNIASSVEFAIVDGADGINGENAYLLPGGGSTATVSVNGNGEAFVTLTSSNICQCATVIARVQPSQAGDAAEESCMIEFVSPDGSCSVIPEEIVIGEDTTAALSLVLTCGSQSFVSGHEIHWKIGMITVPDDTADDGFRIVYDSINYDPPYDDCQNLDYGSLSPSVNNTDTSGISTSTYTVGTEEATIYFISEDYNVYSYD